MNCIYTQRDLERVTDQYSAMVYRLAYAIVRSKSEAEDVYQDVFLTLMNENPVFPLKKDERDYLIKETIYSAKKHKAAKYYQPNTVKVFGQEVKDGKEGYILDSMLHGVRKRNILMLHLSVVEGISQKEIAELLSCGKGKVRRTIRQANERIEKNEKERLERKKRVHKRMLEDRRDELMKVTYHEVYPKLFQDYKVEGKDDKNATIKVPENTGEKERIMTEPVQDNALKKVPEAELTQSDMLQNSTDTEQIDSKKSEQSITQDLEEQEEQEEQEEHDLKEVEEEPLDEAVFQERTRQENLEEAKTVKISIEKIRREREKQKKDLEEQAAQQKSLESQAERQEEQTQNERQEASEAAATTDAVVLEELSFSEQYQKLYEDIVPSVFLKNEIMCHLLEILYERICKREEERVKQERIHDKERGIYQKQKSLNGEYQNISIVKPERLLTGGRAILLAMLVCVLISAPLLAFAISYDDVFSYLKTTVANYFKPIGTSDEQSGIRMKVLDAIQDGESAVFFVEVTDEEDRFNGEIALKDYTVTSLNSFYLAGSTKISEDTSIVRFVTKEWDQTISSQVRLAVQSVVSGITRYDDFLVEPDPLSTCKEAGKEQQIPVDSKAVIEENGDGYEVVLGEQDWKVLIPLGWEQKKEQQALLEQQGSEVDKETLKQIERKQEIAVSKSISEAYLSGIGIIDGNLHIQADWGETNHTGSFYLLDQEGRKLYPYISFRFDMNDEGQMKAGSTYEEYIFLTKGEDLSQYQLTASEFVENNVCIDGDWRMNFNVTQASGSIDLTTKGKIYGAKLHKFTITPAKILIRGTYGSNVKRIRVDIVSQVQNQSESSKKSLIEELISSKLLSKLNLTSSQTAATEAPSPAPSVSAGSASESSTDSTATQSEPLASSADEEAKNIQTQTSTYLYIMSEDDEETFTLSWTPTLPIDLDDILEVYLNGSLVYDKKAK